MSQLPKYRPELGAEENEESVGLLGSDAPHPYPPSSAPASGAPRSVIYQLRPSRALCKDLEELDAVSVIGRDRAESVNLVLSAFPELKHYDEDRLVFSVQSDAPAPITWSTRWARVTDVAWPGLQASAIRVELAGLPGDAKAPGKWDMTRNEKIVVGVLYGLCVAVLGLAAVQTIMEASEDQQPQV